MTGTMTTMQACMSWTTVEGDDWYYYYDGRSALGRRQHQRRGGTSGSIHDGRSEATHGATRRGTSARGIDLLAFAKMADVRSTRTLATWLTGLGLRPDELDVRGRRQL